MEIQEENNKTNQNQHQLSWAIPISVIIAGFLISGAILYSRTTSDSALKGQIEGNPPTNDIKVIEDDDPFLGEKNAKVTFIEFGDYQCFFCKKFWEDTLPQLKKEYIDTGKVKFMYRDFPLSSTNPAARVAAEAAECANDQGKYWEIHDKLFQEQDRINLDNVKKWAAEIGLDSQKLNQCLDSKKYKDEVEKDYNDGIKAGVTATPTIFINGKKVVGALPFATFKSLIEEELTRLSQ